MRMVRVWQIAAGEHGRYYDRLCIDHDIIIMGPGRFGKYDTEGYAGKVKSGQIGSRREKAIKHLCHDMKRGDVVLLRRGYRVVAIGLITENRYQWNPSFDDVYGWGLQHVQRVVWQDQMAQALDRIQPDDGLFASRKQIPTFTRVRDRTVLDPLRDLISQVSEREFRSLPEWVPEPLSLDEVGHRMFAGGLPNASVDRLIGSIERQRRLLRWYGEQGSKSGRPTEHEVVAYMVLPLLLALGWSEQLLAVEWKSIDLAAFRQTPTTPEMCTLVCEAKQMRHGLQGSYDQAVKYVKAKSLVNCQKILLTQGGRFYLYQRQPESGNEWRPCGYVNLEKIRTDHIAPKGTNALETLLALTPGRLAQVQGLY